MYSSSNNCKIFSGLYEFSINIVFLLVLKFSPETGFSVNKVLTSAGKIKLSSEILKVCISIRPFCELTSFNNCSLYPVA